MARNIPLRLGLGHNRIEASLSGPLHSGSERE
jgi:hypothetical protein